jgi:hypothetical protein
VPAGGKVEDVDKEIARKPRIMWRSTVPTNAADLNVVVADDGTVISQEDALSIAFCRASCILRS